jgi:hypothetical protein
MDMRRGLARSSMALLAVLAAMTVSCQQPLPGPGPGYKGMSLPASPKFFPNSF